MGERGRTTRIRWEWLDLTKPLNRSVNITVNINNSYVIYTLKNQLLKSAEEIDETLKPNNIAKY